MPLQTNGETPPIRLMAYIAFSGYDDPIDIDGAQAALQEAGFEVHRLPEKYRRYLEFPLDDHMEAIIAVSDEDEIGIPMWRARMRKHSSRFGLKWCAQPDPHIGSSSFLWGEVNAIVNKFGGGCCECWPIEPDHQPFVWLFEDTPGFVP